MAELDYFGHKKGEKEELKRLDRGIRIEWAGDWILGIELNFELALLSLPRANT